MLRMKLSHEHVKVYSTYEINNIIDKKANIGQFVNGLKDSFLLCEIEQCKILIDPKDVFFLSRICDVFTAHFAKEHIVGFTSLNNGFYTIVDLEILLTGSSKHQRKGIYIYFYNSNNAIQLDHIKMLKKSRLSKVTQELSDDKVPPHVRACTSLFFKDIHGVVYSLLDKNKLKSLI